MGNFCSYEGVAESESLVRDHQVTLMLQERMNLISFDDCESIRSDEEALSGLSLVGRIGYGLFSDVYLAKGCGWGRGEGVAVKVVRKGDFASRESVQKMIVEKEILRILRHRNILRLFGTVQSDQNLYFFLEFCPLGSLRRLLSLRGRLEASEILPIAGQLIETLAYIHSEGIIYGDLKAENVLLDGRGELKLCDFNLSGTRTTLQRKVQGTLSYIAPEVLEGLSPNPKADFWALGVLLHLLFYGKLPFTRHRGAPNGDLIRDIVEGNIPEEKSDRRAPLALRSLISGLLTPNLSKRLASRSQLEAHPFFRGFNWRNFRDFEGSFAYVRGVPPIQPKNLEGPPHIPGAKNSLYPAFQIRDFTFETASPLSRVGDYKGEKVGIHPTEYRKDFGFSETESN